MMSMNLSDIANLKIKNADYQCIFTGISKSKAIDLMQSISLIEKVLVSNKISSCEKKYKYFIGYLYNDPKVKPLQLKLPKTSAYVKHYNGQFK